MTNMAWLDDHWWAKRPNNPPQHQSRFRDHVVFVHHTIIQTVSEGAQDAKDSAQAVVRFGVRPVLSQDYFGTTAFAGA
jgi:hypothetical protein